MVNKARTGVLRLDAMALEIPEFPEHPNRVPFSGVLTLVDRPSDRAPSGAAGHRVLLPQCTAERALPSLLGMAVDYAPGLRGHDARRKIGILTRAEIVDGRLEVSGYLFAKDFPEAIREIRAHRDRLGMSYEVTEVRVANPAEDIWRLEHVVFTGAAILERASAAYQSTSLAAKAAARQTSFDFQIERGEPMDEKLNTTLNLLAQSSQALATEFASLRATVEELRQAQDNIHRLLERQPASQAVPTEIEARVSELARTTEELRRQNDSLRDQAERFTAQMKRKTLSPQILTLLAKSGISADALGASGQVDPMVLDKALDGLSVEQRISIKSQLARAGVLL